MGAPDPYDRFRPVGVFLGLPVSVRAIRMLTYLVETGEELARENWLMLNGVPSNLVGENREQLWPLADSLAEAWNWLQINGLIAPAPDGRAKDGFFMITSLGREVANDPNGLGNLIARQRANLELHDELLSVRPLLELGEYDFAVSKAMLTLEVRVRNMSGLPLDLGAVPLMNRAFGARGQLRVLGSTPSEQDGLRALFAGAMGFFRNPPSHRDVGIEQDKAAEVVVFATLLHRLLDRIGEILAET